jgi:hypothetical protein
VLSYFSLLLFELLNILADRAIDCCNLKESKTLYRKYNILKALKIFEALEKI